MSNTQVDKELRDLLIKLKASGSDNHVEAEQRIRRSYDKGNTDLDIEETLRLIKTRESHKRTVPLDSFEEMIEYFVQERDSGFEKIHQRFLKGEITIEEQIELSEADWNKHMEVAKAWFLDQRKGTGNE